MRDIVKYTDQALGVNKQVEMNLMFSSSLSSSSSFYYDQHKQQQQQQQQQQRLTAEEVAVDQVVCNSLLDLAATPTGSPTTALDPRNQDSSSTSASAEANFFANKLHQSLNSKSNAGADKPAPRSSTSRSNSASSSSKLFMLGDDEDDEEADDDLYEDDIDFADEEDGDLTSGFYSGPNAIMMSPFLKQKLGVTASQHSSSGNNKNGKLNESFRSASCKSIQTLVNAVNPSTPSIHQSASTSPKSMAATVPIDMVPTSLCVMHEQMSDVQFDQFASTLKESNFVEPPVPLSAIPTGQSYEYVDDEEEEEDEEDEDELSVSLKASASRKSMNKKSKKRQRKQQKIKVVSMERAGAGVVDSIQQQQQIRATINHASLFSSSSSSSSSSSASSSPDQNDHALEKRASNRSKAPLAQADTSTESAAAAGDQTLLSLVDKNNKTLKSMNEEYLDEDFEFFFLDNDIDPKVYNQHQTRSNSNRSQPIQFSNEGDSGSGGEKVLSASGGGGFSYGYSNAADYFLASSVDTVITNSNASFLRAAMLKAKSRKQTNSSSSASVSNTPVVVNPNANAKSLSSSATGAEAAADLAESDVNSRNDQVVSGQKPMTATKTLASMQTKSSKKGGKKKTSKSSKCAANSGLNSISAGSSEDSTSNGSNAENNQPQPQPQPQQQQPLQVCVFFFFSQDNFQIWYTFVTLL